MTRAFDDEGKGQRKVQALLEDLEWFYKLEEAYEEAGIVLTGFSVRLPAREGDDVFLVVRAIEDGGKVVAFVDGEDLVDGLRRMLRAMKSMKLKFREDKYE